jgi:hypothetical protein
MTRLVSEVSMSLERHAPGQHELAGTYVDDVWGVIVDAFHPTRVRTTSIEAIQLPASRRS